METWRQNPRSDQERQCSLFNLEGIGNGILGVKGRGKTLPATWGCSSVGRAPALQAGGRGFESLHLHQRFKKRTGTTKWAHSSGG